MTEMYSTASHTKKMNLKFLLFFDINKTIMVKDTSSGKGTLQSINSIISECCWGSFNATKPLNERTEYDWNIYSDGLSSQCPPTSRDQHLVTFGNYLEEFTAIPKSTQKHLKTTFTMPNSIGHRFLPQYEQLVSTLTLPSSSSVSTLPSYFSDGFYHIVPSFFQLINQLVERKLDFRIVWRSFGLDAGNIVDEFNAFCEDRHPFFRPVQRLDGTDSKYPINLLVKLPQQSGVITRIGEKADDLLFSYVSEEQVLTTSKGAQELYQKLVTDILHMELPLNELIHNHSHSFAQTFMLRDDFQYWHRHHESDDSGKIMLVGNDSFLQELSGGQPLVQMFFDDNIERNYAHIVDVRDWTNFSPIPYAQTKDRFLKRVEPLDLIMNENYLIELFDEHVKKYYTNMNDKQEL